MNAIGDLSNTLPLHAESTCDLNAQPSTVFEHIDRPERLSAHMARRSWQLAASSMTIETDAERGQRVGSHIRLSGSMLGMRLYVEGKVVQRDPPKLKAWETVGEPRLLVIGRYRMSVGIDGLSQGSRVKIAIDYALPAEGSIRWLGKLLGPSYARWCVRQMTRNLVHQFGPSSAQGSESH